MNEKFQKVIVALNSDCPSKWFYDYFKSGEMEKEMPNFFKLSKVSQNEQYHPEGNVFIHTMVAIDRAAKMKEEAEDPKVFMLSALLHDVGKVAHTQVKDGVIHHYDHDRIELEELKPFFNEVSNETDLMEKVLVMINGHMKVKTPAKKINKRKKFLKKFPVNDLLLLAAADAPMTGTPDDYDIQTAKAASHFKELKEAYLEAAASM